MAISTTHMTFIGFGEAAQAFVTGFRRDGVQAQMRAFDIKTDGPQAAKMRAAYARHQVVGADTCTEACKHAQVIFSLVTADQAEAAAGAVAQADLDGALYLDCNSCAPGTKRRNAETIAAAGGRYVDVAVMTPVHPRLHTAPCLLAGPHVADARAALAGLGMDVSDAGDQVGAASARKMIRSVMVKGLEALTLECFLAARKAGCAAETLASLDASFPGFDLARRAPYMMERAATHGLRRAAEMEEVAQTLRDLGITPMMTDGTIARQREVGRLGLTLDADAATDLVTVSDRILAELAPTNP